MPREADARGCNFAWLSFMPRANLEGFPYTGLAVTVTRQVFRREKEASHVHLELSFPPIVFRLLAYM